MKRILRWVAGRIRSAWVAITSSLDATDGFTILGTVALAGAGWIFVGVGAVLAVVGGIAILIGITGSLVKLVTSLRR